MTDVTDSPTPGQTQAVVQAFYADTMGAAYGRANTANCDLLYQNRETIKKQLPGIIVVAGSMVLVIQEPMIEKFFSEYLASRATRQDPRQIIAVLEAQNEKQAAELKTVIEELDELKQTRTKDKPELHVHPSKRLREQEFTPPTYKPDIREFLEAERQRIMTDYFMEQNNFRDETQRTPDAKAKEGS